MAILINGEVVAEGTHDYVGIGQVNDERGYNDKLMSEEKKRPIGLMLCSWSFWSGVYHRGSIDEFRIWDHYR
jgi:hypothetical protein